MRIALASDHAGFALKREIAQYLSELGHDPVDFGPDGEDPCDLADFVYPAALAVAGKEVDRGIFVDGVGYGSAMIANKLPDVFAAVTQDPFCAALARSHSDTNVLCLGGKIIGSALAMECVRAWLFTDFLGVEEPKYARRVAKVADISARHTRPIGTVDG